MGSNFSTYLFGVFLLASIFTTPVIALGQVIIIPPATPSAADAPRAEQGNPPRAAQGDPAIVNGSLPAQGADGRRFIAVPTNGSIAPELSEPDFGVTNRSQVAEYMGQRGYSRSGAVGNSICPRSERGNAEVWETQIGNEWQCTTVIYDSNGNYTNVVYSKADDNNSAAINKCLQNGEAIKYDENGGFACEPRMLGAAADEPKPDAIVQRGRGAGGAGGGGGASNLDSLKQECEEAYESARTWCQTPISDFKIINTPMLLQFAGMFAPVVSQIAGSSSQDAGKSIAGQCETAKTLGIALGGLNAAYGAGCYSKKDSCTDSCKKYRDAVRYSNVGSRRAPSVRDREAYNNYWEAMDRAQDLPDYEKAQSYYNTCQYTYTNYVAQAAQQFTQYGMQAAAAANCQTVASNPCMDTRNANLPQCQATCANPALASNPTCLCEKDPNRPDCPKMNNPIADYKPFCQTDEGKKTPYCQCQSDPTLPVCATTANYNPNNGGLNTSMGGLSNGGSLSNDIAALTNPENSIPEGGGPATAAAILEAKARGAGGGGNNQFGLQGAGGKAAGKGGGGGSPELDRGFRTQGGGGSNMFTVPYATQGGKGFAGGGSGGDAKSPFDLKKFLPGKDGFRSPSSIVGPDGITAANGLSIWEKASRQYRIESEALKQ